MKRKHLLISTLLLCICGIIYSVFAKTSFIPIGSTALFPGIEELQQSTRDTVNAVRFPVAKPTVETYEDLHQTTTMDLTDPENVKTVIEYDPVSNSYIMRTRVGDMEVGTPFMLTPEEYQDYRMKESLREYWRSQNEITAEGAQKKKTPFSVTDMSFDLGPLDKIFGPGGVQLKPQGFVEISFGINRRNLDNPTQSQKNRNRTSFKFDEKIQMNVNASVGDKLNFGMNYNTDATFDFDQQKIALKYEGKEDEIIKYLEAGNVSMYTTNSLVRGGSSLFGIRADMQFGKLKVSALASQQQSQSQSVKMDRGAQMTQYELSAVDYDENRHFFLSKFFYAGYDEWIAKYPRIASGVTLKRVEIWITNKRSNFEQPRNIVAFADLAERDSIFNTGLWSAVANENEHQVQNKANNLYITMTDTTGVGIGLRDISNVTSLMDSYFGGRMVSGRDYEKIENARKLNESEYTINRELGYISLNIALQPDEVLAAAYEYSYFGNTYQVGEFSSDNIAPKHALFLKLLKNTNLSPGFPTWNLMMKNIYSLGSYQVQKERFTLNVSYQSDTTGVYLNYIPETIKINDREQKNPLWIRVLGVDRLDNQLKPNPDGFFDYLEGITVISQNGRIIFPRTQPFGSGLRNAINNDAIAEKYVFTELYDSTLTVAKQIAEKNKFRIQGEYKGSTSNVIQLNGMNIPRGSVRVTAGGVTLTEGSDYTVNYQMGEVTIINQSILAAGSPINATYESHSLFNQQRKTLMGLNLSYDFSENFNIGATIMNLSEKPMTMKVNMGDESVNNMLWGLNTSFRTKSQVLTNLIDKLPFVNATQPSQISFNAEFAQLIPGHAGGIDHSYLDDFESTQTSWSLMSFYDWNLASTPTPIPESNDSLKFGLYRSLLAWYTIDGMFTNRNSSLTPSHIKNDLHQLSNHRVREVFQTELFPDRQTLYNEATTIPIFNLAFYPRERGPYALDFNVDEDGFLINPKKRWGGISRKILSSYTDFEKNNFEYIEFWLMDPFIDDSKSEGGELYINLGEISEDILKDGKKFYENGMTADTTALERTRWGYVPKRQALAYAFDSQTDIRIQDVGLNGLSSEQEKTFPIYKQYTDSVRSKLSVAGDARFRVDPFSPYNDPAGDTYHHYRGADYDNDRKSILERYKRFNGTEGNSTNLNDNSVGWSTAARIAPDYEDINEDFTLSETERYYEYKVDIRPNKMVVGQNYITDIKTSSVLLRNGEKASVKWYQFKIPLQNPTRTVPQPGSIRDFKSIRFMRMYLTDFADTVVMRFGTLGLVRGEWRRYERDLNNPNLPPIGNAMLDVYSVNLEENGSREPVNYVLPPGVSRILDPSQPQLRQNNERSLSLRVTDLSPGDARAVYRNTNYDMRQYKRLQMFVHAEKFINDVTGLANGQVSMFIRLGSDYRNNYYEYEIPLNLTPPGRYDTYKYSDQETVWPQENMLDLVFEKFTDLKLERNAEKRKAGSKVTFATPYYKFDSDNPRNKLTIVGNPSLSEVKTIMIGVRNNSGTTKSAEIWVNELRLTDFNEQGGWAAKGNLNVALSDVGTVNMGGQIETAGFGNLEQSVSDRRLDDYYMYNVATNVNLGRFLPKQIKISAPLYYAYSEQVNSPKYNPLDGDVLLSESLSGVSTKAEKDSINGFAREKITNSSFSLSNIRFDIKGKNPMPYDPSNFTFGYSQNINRRENPATAWETTKDYRLNLGYGFSSAAKPFEPFAKIKSKSPFLKPIQAININYLPNSFGFISDITRNYYELQLRDMSNPGGSYENINLAFREDFYWNRAFNIRWNLSKSLQLSFDNLTRAQIETPYHAVNKELFPDEYQQWKDSVWHSIRKMGSPLSYSQTFDVSYTLPFGVIPILNWINSTAKYTARYTWDRGALIDDPDVNYGNMIANEASRQIEAGFNMETLYNKSSFLKGANQKFGGSSTNTRQQTPAGRQQTQRAPQPKKFDKQIQLSKDSAVVVTHNLNTKNIRVKANRPDSTNYPVNFKKISDKAIRIQNRDSISIKLSITEGPDPAESAWYKTAQYAARGLMMLRQVSVRYKETNSAQIPGFLPEAGGWVGQGNMNGPAPGWGFALGLVDNYDFIYDSYYRGWLTGDSLGISPAVANLNKDFSASAKIEPIKSMKIDLDAKWNHNNYTQVQYMYKGMPEFMGGNYAVTTIALNSFFQSANRKNGYETKAFKQFLENREILTNRIQSMYDKHNVSYPNADENTRYGKVDSNSPEVLIPAFLSAYTTGNPNKIKTTAFPSLLSILPNWRISYDGLSQIGWVKNNLKSITLDHSYRCSYNVGAYDMYLSWLKSDFGDLGFVPDVQTGNLNPSFRYNINSVTVREEFSPLLGINVTFKNNVSCKGEYKTSRILDLKMAANQIVEASSDDFVLGLGYKFLNFNNVIKMKPVKNVNHDLTLRGDISYKLVESIIHKIEEYYSEPVSGTKTLSIKLNGEYNFSKALTMRLFFDRQVNTPLVSSASFPTATSNFGIALRFSLTR